MTAPRRVPTDFAPLEEALLGIMKKHERQTVERLVHILITRGELEPHKEDQPLAQYIDELMAELE